jgi:membrane-associated protease RseP (regulator of RpoE activity)
MSVMKSDDGMEELQIIDADDRKVAALLRTLPRVEAPANFEFRVKAGIAKASPLSSAAVTFLKTAAPLALILVVVTFGILYYQEPNGTTVDPDRVASSGPVIPPARTEAAPLSSPPAMGPAPEIASGQPVQASTERHRAVPKARTAGSDSNSRAQGGSVDRIIHPANVIMPPGFESANPQNRNANTTSTDVPVREVLEILGLTTDFSGDGWKVRSVAANSIAARSDVKAGDVIEAVDGQPVKKETKLKSSAKTFTVRRDGKSVDLTLRN